MLGLEFYQIPHPYDKSYIVQTRGSFKACLKEHIVGTTHNSISKSTIVEHYFKSKHLFFFDQTKILASTPYHSSRVIQEAPEIEKHPNNFNRDDGYKLNQSWKFIIYRLGHQT
jgi:hypothetical protein